MSVQEQDRLRVLLINAPFGLIEFPNLGTSLIKAATNEAGFPCDVYYGTVDFARRIGFSQYLSVERADCPLLLPERPFARALSEKVPPVDEYYDVLVEPFQRALWTFLKARSDSIVARENLKDIEEAAIRWADEVADRPGFAAYDVFGFTSSFGQNTASLALARRLKARFPDKVIAFGGANCEGRMGQQLVKSFPFVDYAFSGDGDVSFPVFLQALQQGRTPELQGVFSSRAPFEITDDFLPITRQNLDELPYPDFSDFFASYARAPEGRGYHMGIPVEGSRGCWWGDKQQCTFCGLNGLTMTYRSKSPERFRDELEFLVERYGETHVMATDNILDFRYLKTVVPLLREKRSHEVLFFEVKANLRKDQLQELAEAGISHLQPGIESLSTPILKLMRKGITALQNVRLLKAAQEVGTNIVWNVICGFPGEKAEHYEEMADLMEKIPHLQPPKAFARLSIDRFSPYFNHPEEFEITIAPSQGYSYVYDIPEDEIENLAYWYFYECDNGSSRYSMAPPDYAKRAVRVRMIWETLHSRVTCCYRTTPDGRISIEDTRPVAKQNPRRLDALESLIFRLTDQIAGRAAIEEKVLSELAGIRREEIGEALRRLEDEALLLCEGERYLALPIQSNGRGMLPLVGESNIHPL